MKSSASLDTVERVSDDFAARSALSGGFGVTALWTLYVLTIRQHLHGKRWMVMGVLFLLPVVLAIVIRATAPDVPGIWLEFLLAFIFIPQALLPLVALIYASGIIRDEQEDQTITYLLIRPIPKWALYGTKLFATLTTTVALTTVFTVLTYAAIYLGGDAAGQNILLRCLKAVGIHSLAVAAYCCLFGLMSFLTRYILVVGILYILVFEWLLANLPFSIRLVTIIYYARLIAYCTLDFVAPIPRGTENIAAKAWQVNIEKDPQLLEHPQFSTCLIVLLVGSFVCALLAAVICSQREFYVKTPEKS
jgi:ABC-2 type transport system permease protein